MGGKVGSRSVSLLFKLTHIIASLYLCRILYPWKAKSINSQERMKIAEVMSLRRKERIYFTVRRIRQMGTWTFFHSYMWMRMYMDIGASGLVNSVVGIYEVIFGDIKSKAIN